jgi:predicted Zn-dependent protease
MAAEKACRMLRPAAFGLALLASLGSVAAAPRVPVDQAEVLATVLRPADPGLAMWRRELARNPGDLGLALRVAWRYAELASSTQDSRYAGYAQAALAPWWGVAEPPAEVLILRATLRQHRHEFANALADLDRAAALASGDARLWLTRAAVLQVMGRNAEAHASCARLRRLAPPLIGVVCEAAALARLGRGELAAVMLDGAIGDGVELPPGVAAWAWGVRGEIAAGLGRDVEAARWLEAAVASDAGNAFAVNALADHLLDTGQPARALELVAGDRRNDGKLLRQVLAKRALGLLDGAGDRDLLRMRFAEARWRGDSIAEREEARFLLADDADPAAALRLARANWAVQREPIDARLLLEAARRAGDRAAAAPVLAWLDETGLQDVRIGSLARALRDAPP